jgi:hypothetical protein
MLGWFKAIMPKEERFFAHFVLTRPSWWRARRRCAVCSRAAREIEHYCKVISERETEATSSPGWC